MFSTIKKIILNSIAGANVVTVILMLLVGYSDRINPEGHEWLACAGMIFPIFVLANLLFVPLWVFLSWKRMWIPLLGFALAYVPIRIYMPLHGAPDTPPKGAIRIISWNVCSYGGNYKYEHALDSVFKYVKEQQADIVCFQEDTSDKHKAMNRYSEFFAYNDTTRIPDTSGKMVNALGIHTRFPILRKEKIESVDMTTRSVAYYLLVGSDTVIVINNHLEGTHLSTSDRSRYKNMIDGTMHRDTVQAETRFLVTRLGESMAKRAPQARAINKYVKTHRQYPIIVCGDFNDTPISYTRHTAAKGLTDCFVETGSGFGVSFNQRGFNFRIDHMLVSEHFTPYGCKIDNENDVSDHYPVLCWLQIGKKP